ncbi:hypothetical protein E9993_14745 [Labilibacter sediminis]|nr:hypothetical protein E9993_14745 [Labilibacter sediminis]
MERIIRSLMLLYMGKVTLQSINKNLPGGANMGGITQTVYVAYWDDVDTWPTEPDFSAGDVAMGAAGELTGNLTLKSTKQFFAIYLTDDTGEFKIDTVGEKDGKSFVKHLSFFHPGLGKEALGFLNMAKNENLVFIVPDNNGNLFLMGDALRPATFEGSPDGAGTGKETAARAGISTEFTYKTKNVYQYTGAVPLTPAV